MKLNCYFHQHFNTGGKQLSGTFLKVGFQQAVDIIAVGRGGSLDVE